MSDKVIVTGAAGFIGSHLAEALVRRGDSVVFRTGAGIVAYSDPQGELEETRHKAEGLLRSLRS